MKVTNLKDILAGICLKHHGGCTWKAKKHTWFSHVKLTKTKSGHPDLIEFRTRFKHIKNKDPNVVFYKLQAPVMSTGYDWYIDEDKLNSNAKTKKINVKVTTKKNKAKILKEELAKIRKEEREKIRKEERAKLRAKTRAKLKLSPISSSVRKTRSKKNKNFAKIVRTVKDCLTYKCRPHKLGSKSYKHCINKNCRKESLKLQTNYRN